MSPTVLKELQRHRRAAKRFNSAERFFFGHYTAFHLMQLEQDIARLHFKLGSGTL